MQVTMIGSGNVATVLGRMLLQRGHGIRQVYSRHQDHAASLADALGAMPVSAIEQIDTGADIYILCVTDDAMEELAGQLVLPGKLLIHTAGSLSKDLLSGASNHYGVLWPMKMIRKTMRSLGPVTIVVDGNNAETVEKIREIALLFTDTVTVAGDAMRVKMHMLASVTANFPNHLYHLAAVYCKAEGIDFSLFYPIIEETAKAIQAASPAALQAGPAFRKDLGTLQKHRHLLREYPQLAGLYSALSESLLSMPGQE